VGVASVSNKRRRLSVAALALISVLAAGALVGTVGPAADDSPRSTFSLGEAREFSSFPVYYAGDSVDGVPLVAVLRRADSANYISFIYGSCDASGDAGCAPPGEVQVWPACVRNPSRYASNRSPISPVSVPTEIRGAPAASFEEGHRLEIQTGVSTVVLFGHTPQFARGLASNLRGLNNGVPAGADLPPPAAGAIEGTLECAR
jgi:hypothetical protein